MKSVAEAPDNSRLFSIFREMLHFLYGNSIPISFLFHSSLEKR